MEHQDQVLDAERARIWTAIQGILDTYWTCDRMRSLRNEVMYANPDFVAPAVECK